MHEKNSDNLLDYQIRGGCFIENEMGVGLGVGTQSGMSISLIMPGGRYTLHTPFENLDEKTTMKNYLYVSFLSWPTKAP